LRGASRYFAAPLALAADAGKRLAETRCLPCQLVPNGRSEVAQAAARTIAGKYRGERLPDLAGFVAKVGDEQLANKNAQRSNRASGFLNQYCVLVPDLESMLLARDTQNLFATIGTSEICDDEMRRSARAALVFALESILFILVAKIVLQHIRGSPDIERTSPRPRPST